MSTPTVTGQQVEVGRNGSRTWSTRWNATDLSDFVGEPVLDIDDIGTEYITPAYAVTKVEWSGAATITGRLYFDSGDDGEVLRIPDGSTNGEIDFGKMKVNGCVPDPDRLTPGSVVLDTEGAADGDALTITLSYRVKGTRRP